MPAQKQNSPVRVMTSKKRTSGTNKYPHRPPTLPQAHAYEGLSKKRKKKGMAMATLLPAWTLIILLVASGAGVVLNPIPVPETGPQPWEVGQLIPEGNNLYRLSLCAGEQRSYPFGNGNFLAHNPWTTNGEVGQLSLTDGGASTTLDIMAGYPGQAILSFVMDPLTEELQHIDPLNIRIFLQVGLCQEEGEEVPDDIAAYMQSQNEARPPSEGYLVEGSTNNFHLVACAGERYSYLFAEPTLVKEATTEDTSVGSLVLYGPPARLMVYANGVGTTTLTFKADVLEIPFNTPDYRFAHIHISVVACGPSQEGLRGGESQGYISVNSQSSSGDGFNTNYVSVSGGGSVAVSQALSVNSPTVTGDADESLGTSSDDGTAFAAHVELNPGDASTIFVGVSNQGENDITYKLHMVGARHIQVSAEASGGIAQMVQTCEYCWKFVLPGGVGGAGTGIHLNVAVPDHVKPGFYSLGEMQLYAVNS